MSVSSLPPTFPLPVPDPGGSGLTTHALLQHAAAMERAGRKGSYIPERIASYVAAYGLAYARGWWGGVTYSGGHRAMVWDDVLAVAGILYPDGY